MAVGKPREYGLIIAFRMCSTLIPIPTPHYKVKNTCESLIFFRIDLKCPVSIFKLYTSFCPNTPIYNVLFIFYKMYTTKIFLLIAKVQQPFLRIKKILKSTVFTWVHCLPLTVHKIWSL